MDKLSTTTLNWITEIPPAPPGLAFCPNCGGHGHTGEADLEGEPGKFYDCYICYNQGYVPEAYAAEWNQDLEERAAMEEESHLAEMQSWNVQESEREFFSEPDLDCPF